MFYNQLYGRMSVKEDGTLLINSVQKEDAGEYTCQALSMAGSIYANAKLQVNGAWNQWNFIVIVIGITIIMIVIVIVIMIVIVISIANETWLQLRSWLCLWFVIVIA